MRPRAKRLFEVTATMKPVLSVIVPCYNEEANLPELAQRLHAAYERMGLAGETLLVDDASKDGTFAVVQELEGRELNVRGLRHERNQGMFAAWLTGLAAARGDYIAVIDADLQYQPEDIARLWEHLHWSRCDVAQGARFNITESRSLRFWLSRGMNALLNLAFRMSLHDNKSGFFITRREVAEDMLRFTGRYAYPQSFVMVAAHAKGYSIGEVRTVFAPRRQGKSFIGKFPLLVVLRCLADIALALPEFRWRRARIVALGKAAAAAPRPPAERDGRFRVYINLMPLHHWMITSDAGTYLKQLEQTQWLPPEQIKALQNERLAAMVQHAYQHVPFYRRRMDQAGIRPSQVASIADLAALPPLTKDDIRQHLYFDLLADNAKLNELYPIRTSGSTGVPLTCYVDRAQLEVRWASTLRSQEWTGYRFGDRTVRLWHQTIGMTPVQVAKEVLDAWFCRRLFIPAYRMRADTLANTFKRIRRHRPTMIDGYAESFNLLAHYLEQHPMDCPTLRGLMSSAQTLSRKSREVIERAFGCKVFDKYGSREFSGIAYECDHHQGHHVMAESYIVEIVKDGRPALPGEIGEVLITDLNNRCMPFLRYKVGDLAMPAAAEVCSCGRGLPLIGEVMGRVQAIIIGADNQFLPGTFFAHLFKEYDHAIKQFQVYQERLGAIELRIVKGGRYSEQTLEEILATLHDFLGAAMQIDVVFLDEIPLVRTGKFQHSISKLRFDFQTLRAEPILGESDAPAPYDDGRPLRR